ncbi:MAG TPA: circularly permuted type 2 ATP-grasp protein [Kiritimatiellia bacterium]|nr:circularly permuted type 2 ATP-grasp protein [Kiritimatiellia bacterium]HMP97984.1 circularly permuted type 2 ATP-grasp protein [Kiritimatiellia bacterium]
MLLSPTSERYAPGASYDEMWDANGQVRPHWQHVMRALDDLGGHALEKIRHEAKRIFRENGVSYNVHGDPHGHQRTWELDPIPLIISSEDWADIEAGLVQRAELMNLILADLYGQRKLIQQGLLPAELVFGHDGFLRACDQFRYPTGMQLIDFAVDLARGPDGRMWVLRDYTQSPAGIGYALENRTVMTRILPQFFQDGQIHRMSFFFRTLRAGLQNLPLRRKDQPRIVVLTPGPYSELFFEHAYLASYLGYPLVQGDDLTVREGGVWLKTLDGLQPVDVIIRRLSDRFCDPLELAEESLLGVAGLLQAARLGNVVIANPLGSGVLENPGLIPFLPGISRYYLGSELKLPSAATWWCGQPQECRHVLDNLDRIVIKPICRTHDAQSVFGATLSAAERESWRAKILARPHLFVGQEQVSFSTTPCLIKGHIEPRHAAIRTFLTAHEGRYHVMKGGLARAARDRGVAAPSRHLDNISKDTWVIASRPERHISLWLQPTSEEMQLQRSGILASRAAENLYWTGRYAERTEGTARLLRTVITQMNRAEESSDTTHQQRVHLMQQTLTAVTETFPGFLSETPLTPEESGAELRSIMIDQNRIGSIAQLLNALTSAAYLVRDRWSLDNWRVLDGIKNHWRHVCTQPQSALISSEYELDELITSLAAFMGLNMESMTREPGWLMLDSGRRIERALWLIRTVKSLLIPAREELLEHLVLESFLSTHESLITHRRRYRSFLQRQTVLEVLLLDEANPRALAYQIDRLQRNLSRLPRPRLTKKLSAEDKFALEAATQIKLADIAALCRATPDEGYLALLELTNTIENRLMAVSEALNQYYFTHAQGARQLMPTRRKTENL